MISLGSVRSRALVIAQDALSSAAAQSPALNGLTAVQLLLSTSDYTEAVNQALRQFNIDNRNIRVVDCSILTSGFRFGLAGAGAFAELTGPNAWSRSASFMIDVWSQWDATIQGLAPNDPRYYQIVDGPNGTTVLELLDLTAQAGKTMRLHFARPHKLTEAENTVADPTVAPTVATVSASGSVTNGQHSLKYTYQTAQGETLPSPASSAVNIADNTTAGRIQAGLTPTTAPGVTGIVLYLSKTGQQATGPWWRAGTAAAAATTAIVNVSDSLLLTQAPAANTAGGLNSPDDDFEDALAMLSASMMLELAAVKSVQNTGNTGLPNDIVDRRTQSDIYRSRAKELLGLYKTAMGLMLDPSLVTPASSVRELDAKTSYGSFRLWPH